MAQQDDCDPDGLIDVAMEFAMEDAAVTIEMKTALQAGRLRDALLCACRLAGIEPTDVIKSFPDPQTDPAQKPTSCHVM